MCTVPGGVTVIFSDEDEAQLAPASWSEHWSQKGSLTSLPTRKAG